MPLREQHRLRVAALLIAVSLAGCGTPEGESASGVPSGKGLNVLLISIDTLRADHLGCYGYQRPTSPNIDAFAKESVRFAQAISQAPWTTPSHMTLMTSVYPSCHGLNLDISDLKAGKSGRRHLRALAPQIPTLAELLRANGYRTRAITGGATVGRQFGFARGFDIFIEGPVKINDQVRDTVVDWFEEKSDKPFFAFVHTFEVHAPYSRAFFAPEVRYRQFPVPPAGASANQIVTLIEDQRRYLQEAGLYNSEVSKNLYDGGILAADRFFGDLIRELRRLGLYDNTLIIVLSDHGEEFADHRSGAFYDAHAETQYDELIRVPLLVRYPRIPERERVVDRPVGLIDVAPTVLQLLGVELPTLMQGHSFAELLIRDSASFSWTVSSSTLSGPEIKAWRGSRFKYIASFQPGPHGQRSFDAGPLLSEQLYDLLRDPAERVNVANSFPRVLTSSRAALFRHFDVLRRVRPAYGIPSPGDSESLEKALKALGYI